MRKFTITAACALALTLAAAGAAPLPGQDEGGYEDLLRAQERLGRSVVTSLPSTCVSAQGGTPHVGIYTWAIPYKFRLGDTEKVDYGYPKTHYHITTHHQGKRISGKLSMNWSELSDDGFGDYIILECLGTASFNLAPR
jgi:hypothetical protein